MKTKTILIQEITADELSDIISDKLLLKIEKYILNHAAKQNEELLTRKELSKYLKVSLSTINNWSKFGVLQPYRIGNQVRYKKSEIKDALIRINND